MLKMSLNNGIVDIEKNPVEHVLLILLYIIFQDCFYIHRFLSKIQDLHKIFLTDFWY